MATASVPHERTLHCDYVVVGAGAAGCILANRLSENGRYSVVLIEAGGHDSHPLIHVPAGVGALIGHRQLDWNYATVPQQGAADRSIALPRGRVLGGCTSTNGMVYFRGHPDDYDEWSLLGCTGWSYSDVLHCFRRSESNADFGGASHGRDGPMRVTSYRRVNPLSRRFVEAARSLGHRIVDDFNHGDPTGFGLRQAMIGKGRRVSSATAYLRPASNRSNLTVLVDRLADRVLLDGRRAMGVEVLCGGQRERILAAREVILSAGSFGSPVILERSGIGDGTRLQQLGIAPLHHLPEVGMNLQDHVVAPVQMLTNASEPYVVDWRALPRLIANLAQYAIARGGPLASNVFEATGFIRTAHADNRPDVQLIFMPMHRAPGPVPRRRGYGILVGLLRPQSRGEVHAASADPRTAPRIDPRFFRDERDLPPLIEGIAMARRIFADAAFAPLKASECIPGPEVTTETDIAQAIRASCATVHHPVGTCRMGRDTWAVTDPQLRVNGVAALRVVDASIMPRIIGGNTAAPVYMIAEKASNLILSAAGAGIP